MVFAYSLDLRTNTFRYLISDIWFSTFNVAEEVYQAALIFPLAVKTLIIKLSVKP